MNLTPGTSPDPASQNPPFPPTGPAAPVNRRRWLYWGLAGIIVVGCCCLLIVAVLVAYYYTSNRKAIPAATVLPVIPPTETALPSTSTSLPATAEATLEVSPTPTPQNPFGNAPFFADDFSNSNGPWYTGFTDEYEASYTQGSYSMAVKLPNYYFVSTPPNPSPDPSGNIILKVRAKLAPGDTGEIGIICDFQDIDNFYLAAVAGDQFYIGKQVEGEWSDLTSPGLQPLPDSTPDQDGYLSMGFSCIDSFLVLEVNGIGAAHVTDDTFSNGDFGLYVYASDQLGQSGYYARGYFDDFSAALP
jgi:hypothetical protein